MKLAMPSAIDLLARALLKTVDEELGPLPSAKQIDVHQRIHGILTDYDGWRERQANHYQEIISDYMNVTPTRVVGVFYANRAVEREKKAAAMAEFYRNGETLEQIGARYGVTRERVRQLIKGMVPKGSGGGSVKSYARKLVKESSPQTIKRKLRELFAVKFDRVEACRIAGLEHDSTWTDLEFCGKIYAACGLVNIKPYYRCSVCHEFYKPTRPDRRCDPCNARMVRIWNTKPENKLKAKAWVTKNKEKTRSYARKYWASDKGKASMARQVARRAAAERAARLDAKKWAAEQTL